MNGLTNQFGNEARFNCEKKCLPLGQRVDVEIAHCVKGIFESLGVVSTNSDSRIHFNSMTIGSSKLA